jgi:predicted enzyme related to lactoylglutathione lyase
MVPAGKNPIAKTNAINWFEIPVAETGRARKFYETVLGITMKSMFVEETREELTFFPFEPEGIVRGTSGRVSGALVKNGRVMPSASGTTVYLNANPSVREALGRVEAAGGKVLVPKTKIMAGWIAIIQDTEGNRVGLHAEAD